MKKLQNDKGLTTLGAIPSNVNRGPAASHALLPHDRSLFGDRIDPHSAMKGLKREFTFPPFSVFNTREGTWQARKRMWLKLGIQSEVGRGENVDASPSGRARPAAQKVENADGTVTWMRGDGTGTKGITEEEYKDLYKGDEANVRRGPVQDSNFYHKKEGRYNPKKARAFGMGMQASAGNGWAVEDNKGSGVSIFDPVLCEIMYRWLCPPGGQILDPFAGGSVRGIVAGCLGREYLGIDLSENQIEANRPQADRICTAGHKPAWVVGNSVKVKRLVPEGFAADLVFSCPPYADLEVYSHDPADISNMPYADFIEAYRKIIARSCSLLKPNRFAAWVIGEVRDTATTGAPYYGLVQDTIQAFKDAGLTYYNDIILITAIGSLPLRTRRAFHSSRKVGKTHQNVLVFCKGDPKKAAEANPLE